MTRDPGSWWGLAELGPLPTMAKLTYWWPSAIRRRPMSAETSRSVRPIRGMSPARSWAATRSAAADAASQGRDLVGVLDGPQAAGDRRRRRQRAGQPACRASTKVAQVRSDTASRVRRTDQVGHDGHRVLVLAPGPEREDVGVVVDPGRLEAGHDQGGLAVGRQHQHGQPLERHGLVAGEPGQVGAQRQQQGVDARRRPWPGAPGLDALEPSASQRAHAGTAGDVAIRALGATGRRDGAGRLAGVVARPGERGRLDVGDAHGFAGRLQVGELLRASTTGRPAGDARSAAGTGRW